MAEPSSPHLPPVSALRLTPLGRADLVRLWAAPPELRSTIALQMGLKQELRPTAESAPAAATPLPPKVVAKVAVNDAASLAPSHSSLVPTASLRPSAAQTAKFYRLARVEYVDEDASKSGEQEVSPDTEALLEDAQLNQLFTQSKPKVPLACGWPRIWTRLRAALLRTDLFGPIDVSRLVERLGQGHLAERLPRLRRRRLPARLTLVLDRRTEVAPLWSDQSSVERALFRVLGAPPARSIWLTAGTTVRDIVHGGRRRALDWHSGDTVLMLSEGGAVTRGFDQEGFLVANKQLRKRGVEIIALSPVTSGQLLAGARVVDWETDMARYTGFETPLERLLALTAFAIRVEPGLLRVLRRLVSPSGGLELELALWNHASGRQAGTAWSLLPEVRNQHQERFFELPEVLQRRAIAALIAWHSSPPREVLAEELSSLEARASEWGRPLPVDAALVRAALRRLKLEVMSVAQGSGDPFADAWVHRLSLRVPRALFMHPVLGRTLVRALLEASKDKPLGALAEYVGSADLAELQSAAQPTTYSLSWGSDGLRCEAMVPRAADSDPRPRLHLIKAKQPRAVFHARWEGEGAMAKQGLSFEWRLGDQPKQLSTAPSHFSVTTDQAVYHFERISKPTWAKAIRHDARGLHAELELVGHRHELRWLGGDASAAQGRWISEPVVRGAFEAIGRLEDTDVNSRPVIPAELSVGGAADSHALAKVTWSRCVAWLREANSNLLGIQLRPVGPTESPARFESEHYYPTYNSKGTRSFRFVLEEHFSKGGEEMPWDSGTDGPDVTWAEASGRDEYGPFAEFIFRGVVQRMRRIEPGTFFMGSPEHETGRLADEPQHEVTLSRGYWVADTACTQALWEGVTRSNPSHFKGMARPVEQVSWEDCRLFLERINRERPELELRLLTEAEWEYACRAGTKGAFSSGDNIMPQTVNYWVDEHAGGGGTRIAYRAETVDVRTLPPNGWGLYEMHGNVHEWCADWYGRSETRAAVDPKGPAEGEDRVIRGGSWSLPWVAARSACRMGSEPATRASSIGFRFARGHK